MISSQPRGGTGMLAVFADLEPRWHREFREWLRDDMIPARFRIGGFPHAASYDLIPNAPGAGGLQEPFVTIYETDSIGDLYGAPYQGLRANRDQRDKDFHARFIKPARYTLSWVGPELAKVSDKRTGFSPIAVFDRFDLPDAAIQDFNLWLVTKHLPRLAELEGVLRCRRYLAMEGSPRHVLVHELADRAVLDSPDWRATRAALDRGLAGATVRNSGSYSSALALSA